MDKAFDGVNIVVLLALAFITLYPFLYVLSCSISDPMQVATRQVRLLPKGFSLASYRVILSNPTVYVSYYNTLWYVVVGTLLNVGLTMLAAYPLSRRSFFLGNPIMLFVVFTMFFSGGLIPTFLVVAALGGYDNYWSLILPNAVSVFNILVVRSFFAGTAQELIDAAGIDGAGDWRTLWSVVLPTSRAVTAVTALFYAVGYWNTFFSALLYLPSNEKWPLQMVIYTYTLQGSSMPGTGITNTGQYYGHQQVAALAIQMAVVTLTLIPIIIVYPFVQRHFAKGVLLGAVKG